MILTYVINALENHEVLGLTIIIGVILTLILKFKKTVLGIVSGQAIALLMYFLNVISLGITVLLIVLGSLIIIGDYYE